MKFTRNRVKQFAIFTLFCQLAILSACAQFGLPTADTFAERLAVGYGTVTEVRNTVTTLLKAKKLTADDGDNVLKATDAARLGLDVARSLSKTDMNAAGAKLTSVRTALTALQAYLTERSN
jgi:hypothetical protein